MEVSCTSCPARFAVPDDKVRGRKVRIACKRCGSPIIVDGTSLGPASTPAGGAAKPAAAPAPAAAPKPGVAPKPLAAPKPGVAPKPLAAPAPKPAGAAVPAPAAKPVPVPAPGPAAPRPAAKPAGADENDWSALSDSGGKASGWREPASAVPAPASVPRPGAAGAPRIGGFGKKTMLGGLEAPAGAAPSPPSTDKLGVPPRVVAPPPPSGPPSQRASTPDKDEESEPEWTVALTDTQHEEMRTAEVVQLYARGSIDQETFIWADGMEDWKRPWEIPMIAAALAARGLKPKEPAEETSRPAPAFAMDEPEEGDATIVATVGQLMPPSSRGKIPSGVWHEPGRDEELSDDVGFEDVTVSLDGKSAQDLLKSLGGPEPAAPPSKTERQSKADLAAAQFDDVPTRIQDELEVPPPPSTAGREVDDLLSDMEERTLALQEDALQHHRAMSTADLMSEDQTTIEQRPATGAGESFSIDNLMAGAVPPPGQQPDLFAGVGFGPPPAGRDRPLDSLWEPTGIQSSPVSSQGPLSGPMSAPYPMAGHAAAPAPKKKSGLGCVLVALVLVVLVLGAAAASFFTKQPASLYGPDGRPKIPGLTQ